jgi:hypothetical protein
MRSGRRPCCVMASVSSSALNCVGCLLFYSQQPTPIMACPQSSQSEFSSHPPLPDVPIQQSLYMQSRIASLPELLARVPLAPASLRRHSVFFEKGSSNVDASHETSDYVKGSQRFNNYIANLESEVRQSSSTRLFEHLVDLSTW